MHGPVEYFPPAGSLGNPSKSTESWGQSWDAEGILPPSKLPDWRWLEPVASGEAALLADAEDGRLDDHSLLQAALIASGTVHPHQLQQCQAQFQQWVRQLQEQKIADLQPLSRAEALFRFMHQKILTGGYDCQASDLAQTIQTGRYNCLTACLVYHCLLEAFGIEAVGVEMPGHVRSRLRLGNQLVDVETTCPQWFELQESSGTASSTGPGEIFPLRLNLQKDRTVQQLPLLSQPAALPEKPSADKSLLGQPFRAETSGGEKQISPVGLVAFIYYNRGVDLLAEGRYQEALAANAKALRLAPGHPRAWGNFLATLNNWAVFLGRSGQYPQATELLRHGLELAPSYKPFLANFLHVHYQWTASLCREGRFPDAWQLLVQTASAAPASYQPAFRAMQLELAQHWAGSLLAQGHHVQASAIWQEVRRRLGNTADVLQAEKATWEIFVYTTGRPAAEPIPELENAMICAPLGPQMP
ncbi:MAG: hypothetical protein NZ602_11930 [Thermoguttaceae bacterium]|nr:hypothetical protein [Thermoguttaceae bacterium]MDW8039295.1 tetratricopeptide repeat protein [Thermoguttaceae bacterium]